MELLVLGPVEVAAEGRRHALGSDRQRTIVATLVAATGAVVSPQRLIDGLWGEQPPPSARKTLQAHVSRLRRGLTAIEDAGAGAIVTSSGGYRLHLGACGLDAARFEELVDRARRARSTDPRAAVELLREAEARWRGPAYGELADHEHVRADARRLEHLRESAVRDRIDAQLALGGHAEVLGELDAAACDDPLDERAHGRLMIARYRSGQQAEALAVYRRLQQRLGDEVGIDPSAELQRLQERILRQDEELGPPTAALPVTRAAGGPTAVGDPMDDVPGPATGASSPQDLIGRDEDVAAVADLVRSAVLVTLIGAGGVGKTRLAERVAVTTSFADGVVVCPLAAVHDPDRVAETLIDALGAAHHGARPAGETVVAALGTRRLLLVLDNGEHLLAAVSHLVAAILDQCPNVSVLLTSREPLRLSGERVWQVAPLPVPRAGSEVAEVAAAPAGALFVARARAAEHTFELTRDNHAAVAELCRRLDGIPLAIELAATRVRAMSPADLLARIDQRFALLTGGPSRDRGRHRTLQAVVAWSYDLLGEAEARLFDRLSVFAGSFTLVAVEQVCGGPPVPAAGVAGVLADLVDKSMVVTDRDGGRVRYRLLETLRDYGAARLEAHGAAPRFRRAHAAYHVGLAEELGPRVRDADEGATLTEIDATIDDLWLAHARLVADTDTDGALRLPVALRDYIGHRQRDEMVTWLERALELPDAAAHPAYPAALATVARGATRRGQLERARRYAEAALDRVDPDGPTALWALHALAGAALYGGRLDDLRVITDRRLELAHRLGDDYHLALARMMGVLANLYGGDAATAQAQAAAFRLAAERAGNHAMLSWALYAHGESLLDDDPDAAEPLLEQAIELARSVDGRIAEGVATVSLATLCHRRGETDRAVELFHHVVGHWRGLGDWTHQLTTLRNLVELLVLVGADGAAATLHGAVADASPPSFGVESERLRTAWAELERRLGAVAARRAAEQGRQLTAAATIEHALTALDGLRGAPAHRAR